MYEECTFQPPRIYAPGLVDHTLRVNFRDEPGQPVLGWISFHCTADRNVAKFVAQHPRWSHDPTPLVLSIIQNIVWELKILEIPMGQVYQHQTGVRDCNTGGVTYVDIQAKIINEKRLQNWLLPVVNFANTHVVDQIRLFYDQHPHLVPSESTLDSLIADFRRKEYIRRQSDEESQRQHRASFSLAETGVVAFMDESGDPGFNDLMSHYTLVGITVEENRQEAFRDTIRRIPARVWGKNAPSEMHYHRTPDSKKPIIRREFAAAVRQFDARVRCFSVLKLNYLKYLMRCHAEFRRTEECPMDIVLEDYLADPEANIQYSFLSLLLEEAASHICIESLVNGLSAKFSHDRKRNQWMNRALKSGFDRALDNVAQFSQDFFGENLFPGSQLSLPHSGDEPLLWVADWVANEVGKWPYGTNLSQELAELEERFLAIGYDDAGVKRGTGILGEPAAHDFQEIPRDIRRLGRDDSTSPMHGTS